MRYVSSSIGRTGAADPLQFYNLADYETFKILQPGSRRHRHAATAGTRLRCSAKKGFILNSLAAAIGAFSEGTMESSSIMWLLDIAEIERQPVGSRSQRALVVQLTRSVRAPASEDQCRAMAMALSDSGLRRLGYLAQAASRLGGLKLQSPWLALIDRAASIVDRVSVEPLLRSDDRVDEFDQLAVKWRLSTGVDEGLIKQVLLDGTC